MTRGCATYEDMQVYNVECQKADPVSSLFTGREEKVCFCDSDLCNEAGRVQGMTALAAVIMAALVAKMA